MKTIFRSFCYLLLITTQLLLCSTTVATSPNTFDEGVPDTPLSKNRPKPFGANLFNNTKAFSDSTSLNPDYIVGPGDKVSLHIWGAIQADEVSSVDAQGNLFIPEVGPVQAANMKASQLQSLVKQKLRSVYKDGVDAYVTLLIGTPANVFITGPVKNPGHYTSTQSDSLITLLQKAGGILNHQGSYRKIKVLRNNTPILSVDLYSFLRFGQLPKLRFQNGDTILVQPQNPTATVIGDVHNNYTYEFTNRTTLGRDLINLSRPKASVTNVALSGSRNQKPWTKYLSIQEFSRTKLYDGDTIRFVTDSPSPTIDISIEGSHLGNSYFAAKRGARLLELLDYIAISPDEADIENIYIKRKSTAAKQKKNLNESLNRLERSILTSPTRSDAEATIRKQESSLISEFIKNARKAQPDGRIVVSENGNVANIRLEDGDIIVIPHRSDIITVSGEVNAPQGIVYATNATLEDYIIRAGGYSERADSENIVIRKPNGQVVTYGHISPGDELIVFPRIDTKSFQFAKDIIQIIFEIAATTKAVGIL